MADPARRTSQLLLEVDTDAVSARRITQLLLEVDAEPDEPLPIIAAPDPIEQPWSPAYAQVGVEGQAFAYASYYGPQRQMTVLGERRRWVKALRR